jgi:TRAP-type transport system periplasmic protein
VKGITDIGQSVIVYTIGRLPVMETINLPLGFTSGYQATKLINALYQKFKPKELDDVHVLYFHAHGPGLFSTKKQIAKMEDLKSQRIKCDGVSAKTVEAMGALPVTMPIPETYDALMKGLVDGILLPMEALKGFRLGELVKCTYINRGAAYSSGQFVTMNKAKWNALPPDIQQIFTKVSEEWIEKQGKQWDELDKEGREFSITKGLKVVTATPEDVEKAFKRTRPLAEAYAKELNKKGLPGDEIIGFCQNFLKTHQ